MSSQITRISLQVNMDLLSSYVFDYSGGISVSVTYNNSEIEYTGQLYHT